MKTVYNIIEVANVHAGDFEYLKELVKEFAQVKGAEAIKFQPFKYDKIAIEDFPWYDVYKKLFLNETQWKEIIKTAITTKLLQQPLLFGVPLRAALKRVSLITSR